MKKECILVRELLPIYCDGAVGEEGKQVIEAHLKDCEECNTYKQEMSQRKKELEAEDKIEAVKEKQVTEASKKLRKHNKWTDVISIAAMVSVWLIFMCCFQVVEVSGISMQPGFKDGERLLMNRVAYHITVPKQGDVVSVVLKDMTLLKRVVGIPGDTIEIKEKAIYINGKAEKIEGEEGVISPGELQYPLTLGKDEYFVMGDNVEVSLDSRSQEIGIIKRAEIKTKYVCRFFPFKFGKR